MQCFALWPMRAAGNSWIGCTARTVRRLASCARKGLDMSRQAVAKHLAVLEEANLVSWKRNGREKLHFINPVPINEIAERWISKFERSRLSALSELKKNLEGERDD